MTAAWIAPAPGPDSQEEVRKLLQDGHYAKAETRARELLADTERGRGRESPEVARALDVLVDVLWRGGKAAEAESLQLAERAIAIKSRVFGPDHIEVARSLVNLAVLLEARGDLAGAEPLYRKALGVVEKARGLEHPQVAIVSSNLGDLLCNRGSYAEARVVHERALAIREKAFGPDSLEAAKSLNNLANLFWETGDYAEARRLYERALRSKEASLPPEHPELARSVSNLATVVKNLGDFAGARSLQERALEIREKSLGPEHPDVAESLNNLGILLGEMGDYAAAIPLYERAITIQEKALGPEHPDLAVILDELGSLLRKSGGYERAKALHLRALAIREKALGREHRDVAESLTRLGQVEEATGRYADARRLYERALTTWEKAVGPDHVEAANCLLHFGQLLAKTGGLPAAKAAYLRALAIGRKALGADHPWVGTALASLAAVHARMGSVEEALDEALTAEAIGRQHLELTARSLPERQALRYASVRASGLDVALALAARGLDASSRRRVWGTLVASRALVLDEMARRRRATMRLADPEAERLGEEVGAARTRLANLVWRGPAEMDAERYRRLLEAARIDKERAERALAEKGSALREEIEASPMGLDRVAKALPPGSALVAYARYRTLEATQRKADDTTDDVGTSAYLAFVLPAGGQDPVAVPLGRAGELESRVQRWREAILPSALGTGGGVDPSRVAGEALRKAIWDPITAHLGGARRVFVVPDHALNLVSLAALPVSENRYLVEREPLIHYLAAERDLAGMAIGRPTGSGLLILGAPAYDDLSVFEARVGSSFRGDSPKCGDFRSIRFAPLPGTARETEVVPRLWEQRAEKAEDPSGDHLVIRLEGTEATEAAFKARAAGRRVLHLSTHGFFLGGRCPSALSGSRGIGEMVIADEAAPPSTGDNPLVLSGLALAGANRRAAAGPSEEDGILTAEEVAALNLSGVEWAVLSACDTGLGEIRAGEGVLGLRRAFQVAGVRTVVMSLWQVEDEAALQWMTSLYRARWLEGMDTGEAARKASLEALRDRRASGRSTHPFYWAGFVAAGDWR